MTCSTLLPLDAVAALPAAGGKAQMLARARQLGLAVPDGFVVLPDVVVADDELAHALARLGADRFVVRSSADVEDRRDATAAGVFETLLGVSATDIQAAIEQVRASALREPARAYLAARGLGHARVAVLVQPEVNADRLGVLRIPGWPYAAGELLAEEREPGEPEWGLVESRRVPLGEALGRGALRLAELIGGPTLVEYALTSAGPVFLQARAAPHSGAAPGEPPLLQSERAPAAGLPARPGAATDIGWDPGDDATWHCDLEHNPAPLSQAQCSLVELCSGVQDLPRQRLLNGYLFYTRAGATPPHLIPPHTLPHVFAHQIRTACEAVLAPLERDAAPGDAHNQLQHALQAYRVVAEHCLGGLGPSLRHARHQLDRFLRTQLGDGLAAHSALLGGIDGMSVVRDQLLWELGEAAASAGQLADTRQPLYQRYLARFGACAPAWDVASPPDEEAFDRVAAQAALVHRGPAPAALHAAALAASHTAAEAILGRLDRMSRRAFKALLEVVRAALPIAEEDDLLFFRAQRVVRRPLLLLGRQAADQGALDTVEQIFDVPIPAALRGQIDRGAALAARDLRQAQHHIRPPRMIVGRAPSWQTAQGATLRGTGVPGWARGRVFIVDEHAIHTGNQLAVVPPRAVLVTAAILPSLTFLLPGCAGLVTDHGGALCHGALLAREYGIPAVLGTLRATAELRDGEEVVVDGDTGRVLRLEAS